MKGISILVFLLFVGAGEARAQCGTLPCMSVQSDAAKSCPGYDIPPFMDLISHRNMAATVEIAVTSESGGKRNTGVRSVEIGPNGQVPLGCSGNSSMGVRVSYSIQKVTWH